MDVPIYVGNPVFKPGGMLGGRLRSGFTIIWGHFTQMRVRHVEKKRVGEGKASCRARGVGVLALEVSFRSRKRGFCAVRATFGHWRIAQV